MNNGTSSAVLVLTYEFPPAAGSGVQRIAKLCKFLPELGITPHVITAAPAPGQPLDASLERDVAQVPVTRLPARDPSRAIARALRPVKMAYSRLRRGDSPSSVPPGAEAFAGPSRVPASMRLARLISDDDASFWARSAVRAGVHVGKSRGVSAVVASGPPFSVLVAGARVAEALGVPFLADMRDGWLSNPGMSPDSRRFARAQEAQGLVMRRAAAVTCVSDPISSEARAAGAARVETIPNGFDVDDMPVWEPIADGVLRVGFMGRIYGLTDLAPFLSGLARASSTAGCEAPDVLLEVVGPPSERLDEVAHALGIDGRVISHGLLPHAEALARMSRMDLGLVAVAEVPGAEAVYTTKLFEYLGMGLPVLVVGPEAGAAATLVRETRAGWTVRPADTDALAGLLRALSVEKRHSARIAVHPDATIISRFERRALATRFARILADLTR